MADRDGHCSRNTTGAVSMDGLGVMVVRAADLARP